MSGKKLKNAIEELSKQEIHKIKLLREVKELVQDSEIENINDLPLLYRLELKKALKDTGKNELANAIED